MGGDFSRFYACQIVNCVFHQYSDDCINDFEKSVRLLFWYVSTILFFLLLFNKLWALRHTLNVKKFSEIYPQFPHRLKNPHIAPFRQHYLVRLLWFIICALETVLFQFRKYKCRNVETFYILTHFAWVARKSKRFHFSDNVLMFCKRNEIPSLFSGNSNARFQYK